MVIRRLHVRDQSANAQQMVPRRWCRDTPALGSLCSPQAGCQYTEPVLLMMVRCTSSSRGDAAEQEADDIVNYFPWPALDSGPAQDLRLVARLVPEAMNQAFEYTVPNPDDRVEWAL